MTPEVDADNPEVLVSRLYELARDESLEDKIRCEWWSLRRLVLN